MSSQAAPGAGADASAGERPHRRLDHDEFVRRFREVSRALWCIAAGHAGGRQNADDIVQQAALIALERLDEFDASTSFLAWMSKIVRLTSLNEVHKDQRRRTAAADPSVIDAGNCSRSVRAEPLPISLDGTLKLDQQSFDDDMIEALGRLDGVARACLLLRVCLSVPYKELAAALDIPAGTAMSHVDRARRAVREHLTASRRGAPAGGAGAMSAGREGGA